MRERLLVVVGVLFSVMAFHPTFAGEIFSTHVVDTGKTDGGTAVDRTGEGRPLAIWPAGVKQSDLSKIMEIKHGDDDFVDRNLHVLHVTGTSESRDAGVEKALARFAKEKQVKLEKLTDLQKLTLIARMVKEDKNLTLNDLAAIYNSAVVMKLIAPAAIKAKDLAQGQEKLLVTNCIMKEVCNRLNLPDAYNIQVSEQDSVRFTDAMGKAIGGAIADGFTNAAKSAR